MQRKGGRDALDCLSQIDMWPISPSLSIEGVKRPQLSISSIERKINCLYSGKLRASSFLPTAPCSCPNIGACGSAECCPGCTFSTDPDHCLFDKATFSSFCSRSSQESNKQCSMPFQYCEVKGYSVSGFSFTALEKSHYLNLDF